MAVFTCITKVRKSFHLSQHKAIDHVEALREHIAALPFDDGVGPFDKELTWLQNVSGGTVASEFIPVDNCKGTWLWLDGARHNPQYITYIVRTDVGT